MLNKLQNLCENGSSYRGIFVRTKMTRFPDGSADIFCPKFGYNVGMQMQKQRLSWAKTGQTPHRVRNILESQKRSRRYIIQLIRANSFDYFGTLTIDPKKLDPLNYPLVKRHLSKWLKSQARYSDFKYLLVPEKRDDGSLHFHGLFRNFSSSLIPAMHPRTGKLLLDHGLQIYNVADYPLGFSDVTQVQSLDAVSVYVSKYIVKDLVGSTNPELNKKTYWHSRGLVRPVLDYSEKVIPPDLEKKLPEASSNVWGTYRRGVPPPQVDLLSEFFENG